MKKILFVALAIILSAGARAEQKQPQGGQQGGPGQEFQDVKNRMLDRVDHRIDALQKMKSCIEQARDPQSLRDCRPERGDGDKKRR